MAQHKAQRYAAPGRKQIPIDTRAKKFQAPGHYTDKDREKISDEDFGDPANKKYPIVTSQDVIDASKLIGHADNPDAVKARIIAIAKRKNFPLPDAWKEGEGKRVVTPDVTRSATPDTIEQIGYAQVTRIDEGKREVTLTATSERRDSFKTRFDYEASKDAFRRWLPIGNIREMHQAKAVGTAVDVAFDDDNRKVDLTLRVSEGAEDTWKKLKDGTLKGGSIGASNVLWEKPMVTRADEEAIPTAKRYDLVEFSLVDNPSNPDCRVIAIRAAGVNHDVIAEDEPVTPPSVPKGRADVASLPPALAALYAEDARIATPAPQSALEAVAAMTVTPSAAPTTPAQAPHEPTTNELMREREAIYQAKLDRADRIAVAGDVAVAQMPPWDPTMDPNQYASMQASTRGRAEAQEIRRIQAEATQQQTAETTRADALSVLAAAEPSTDGHTSHTHDHTHSHRDGVIHSHPHAHSHDDHMTERANVPHAEHEHATYRNQIWDVALLAAEIQRAPFGSQPGIGAWQANKATGKQSSSAVSTVQPQNVGSRTLYNTEDVNALEFGVPPAVTPSATPTGDITLNPAEFHAGGHTSTPDLAADSEKVLTDAVPREKSAPLPTPSTVASSAEPTPELRPGFGGNADFIPGGHPEQFDPASGAYDKDGDYDEGEDIAEAEDGAKVIGTGTPKATAPKSVGEPTSMRADTADEERYNKTISAASAESLHGIMRDAANLCKCPACVIFVSGGEPDGDEDMEGEENDMDEEDEDRIALADTQRQTSIVLSSLTQVVQDLSTRVTQIASSHKEIAAQLANITASQSDQQRMMTAQVTRALHDQQQALDARLASTQQHLERLASLGLETKKIAEVIAMQPAAPISGPAMYAHDKRIALSGDTGQTRGIDAEELAELTRGTSPQTQTELAAALIRRAGPTSIPAPRQRIVG